MIDVAHELAAAREGALLLAAPELGTLEVTGKDRLSWLNGLITSDVGKLRPGEGSFGLSVAKNGKIQAELWIVVAEDRVVVGVRKDRLALLRDNFDHHLIMEDAEMRDASEERAWILVHGPRGADLAAIARANGAAAAPIDVTGLGGAAIAAPVSAYASVLTALEAEGDRVVRGTCEGWERLRIERGVPQWGIDFGDDVYPQEASLEKIAVSFNKGCYLGQETVCMLELRGHVKRKLMKLAIRASAQDVPEHAPITLPDGTAVGELTSRGPSEKNGEALALGYVKYKHAVAGTELRVAGHSAEVLALS